MYSSIIFIQTTKVVVGLLQKCNLLGKGHYVYVDNYYSSPDLFWELHCKEVFACGTFKSNHKNLPKALTLSTPHKTIVLRD